MMLFYLRENLFYCSVEINEDGTLNQCAPTNEDRVFKFVPFIFSVIMITKKLWYACKNKNCELSHFVIFLVALQ
jgi:hypothetical protein